MAGIRQAMICRRSASRLVLTAILAIPVMMSAASQARAAGSCFTVDSRQGWQATTVPADTVGIASITGSWNVAPGQDRSGPEGYTGAQADYMDKNVGYYKYDSQVPFAALLVSWSFGATWRWLPNAAAGSGWFRPGQQVAFRINDVDEVLVDNSGSLEICFETGGLSGLFRSRWDQVGGSWTTGWVYNHTFQGCGHGTPYCNYCPGRQNACGEYGNGAVITITPYGGQGDCATQWQLRCTSEPQ